MAFLIAGRQHVAVKIIMLTVAKIFLEFSD